MVDKNQGRPVGYGVFGRILHTGLIKNEQERVWDTDLTSRFTPVAQKDIDGLWNSRALWLY